MTGSTAVVLGKVDFMNITRDEITGEITQFGYVESGMGSTVQKLMNRAARDIDGVVGVSVIDHTDGVNFALILDPLEDPAAIKSKCRLFQQRVDAHVARHNADNPALAEARLADAMAVSSPNREEELRLRR